VIDRQHIWVGPEATSFEGSCEACVHDRWSVAADLGLVAGTLRREADVGFMTCRRGHRIIVRRVGRKRAATRQRDPALVRLFAEPFGSSRHA
jgi:hypothetical protein